MGTASGTSLGAISECSRRVTPRHKHREWHFPGGITEWIQATDLQQPVVDGGIRSVNFFNGRMLTARDLTREQAANREVDRRLGRAVGEGIAYGFEVSKSPESTNESPVVSVEPGLAVNRQGQTLWLQDKTDVALSSQGERQRRPELIFGECLPLQSGTYVCGRGRVSAHCRAGRNSRRPRGDECAKHRRRSVQHGCAGFRGAVSAWIQIDPPITAAELQDQDHLQNLIAYKCFGVDDRQAFVRDLFGPVVKKYGLLDGLRPNQLTDCDVPLGVLYWTLTDGIKFVG